MTEINYQFLNQQLHKRRISSSVSDSSVNKDKFDATSGKDASNNSIATFNIRNSSSTGKLITNELTSVLNKDSLINDMKLKSRQATDIPFYMKDIDLTTELLKYQQADNYTTTHFLPLLSERQRKSDSSSTIIAASFSQSSSVADEISSNINVVVRVRPMMKIEKETNERNIIEYPGEGGLWIKTGFNQTKAFKFNAVFNETSAQEMFFERCGITELIDHALCGYSCTAFAFGATGSGKTHTITGPQDQKLETMLNDHAKYGLVPRSFKYIFDQIKSKSDVKYSIKASFLEVYNEKVKDLLNASNNRNALPVRWSSNQGFYAENLMTVKCDKLSDLISVLIEGSAMRQVGQHVLNDHSSRSHSMLIVFLDAQELTSNVSVLKHGKINFVDLAGSERVQITKSAGEALVESNNINKSLLTLGNCISALGDRKKRCRHIPYRESKLTKLLADTLGGEGYSLMIACISPASRDFQDSINTLRYANRAKNITNKPVIKLDPKEQLLIELKHKVKVLKAENLYLREQCSAPISESQILINPKQIKEFCCNDLLSPSLGSETFSSFHSSDQSNCSDQASFDSVPRATTAICALGARNGLYGMIQEYMNENERLKAENMELHHTKSLAQEREQATLQANEVLSEKLTALGGGVNILNTSSRQSAESLMTSTTISPNNHFASLDTQTQTEVSMLSQLNKARFPQIRQGYPNYVCGNLPVAEFEKYTNKNQKGRKIENIKFFNLNQNMESESTNINKVDMRRREQEAVVNKHLWRSLKNAAPIDKPAGYAAKFALRRGLLLRNCKHQTAKVHHSSLPVSISSSPTTTDHLDPLNCYKYYCGSKSAEIYNKKTHQLHLDLESLACQIRAEISQNKKNRKRSS